MKTQFTKSIALHPITHQCSLRVCRIKSNRDTFTTVTSHNSNSQRNSYNDTVQRVRYDTSTKTLCAIKSNLASFSNYNKYIKRQWPSPSLLELFSDELNSASTVGIV